MTCRELSSLVERLAQALNERKRVEADETSSPEQRMNAGEAVQSAIESLRIHKSEHHCESESQPEPVA